MEGVIVRAVQEITRLISREFVRKTGFSVHLLPTTFLSGAYENLAPSEKLQERLGEFAITVGAVPDDGRLYGAQWDKDLGVWWQDVPDDRNPGPMLWAAVRFLDGVEVRWWTTGKELDWRWKEIIDIVQAALQNEGQASTTRG